MGKGYRNYVLVVIISCYRADYTGCFRWWCFTIFPIVTWLPPNHQYLNIFRGSYNILLLYLFVTIFHDMAKHVSCTSPQSMRHYLDSNHVFYSRPCVQHTKGSSKTITFSQVCFNYKEVGVLFYLIMNCNISSTKTRNLYIYQKEKLPI